ncbi:hypothetical protein [Cryobacterium sp. Y57]|uniref:hypothetical protein n=1 Tax=Cryobacterium sp. Y57 TaxID=2048287 RepID=UPI0018EB6A56|nr:hypothetical protein [Cryobacterium sp. Y57]
MIKENRSIPRRSLSRFLSVGYPGRLWRIYVPLAKPTIVAFGLVSVSTHWNNFLWPLITTNSVDARPLTVGLQV